MIYCRDCYVAVEGDTWFPASMGRGHCDECGKEAGECYEVEDESMFTVR